MWIYSTFEKKVSWGAVRFLFAYNAFHNVSLWLRVTTKNDYVLIGCLINGKWIVTVRGQHMLTPNGWFLLMSGKRDGINQAFLWIIIEIGYENFKISGLFYNKGS